MNESPRARIGLASIRARDRLLGFGLRLAALPVPVLLAVVLAHLLEESLPAASSSFSMWSLLRGTLSLSLFATALALPPALAGALASRRILSRRGRTRLSVALTGLSAMPMVALGFLFAETIGPSVGPLFGLSSVHPFFAASAMGAGLLPALWHRFLAAFDEVPRELAHGGHALGASPRAVLLSIELPFAMPALARSVAEGLARCAGESMVVLMVSGNAASFAWGGGDGAAALAPALLTLMPVAPPGSTAWAEAHRIASVLVLLCVGLHVAGRSFRRRRAP